MEGNRATACGTIIIDFTIKLSRKVLYIEVLKPEYNLAYGERHPLSAKAVFNGIIHSTYIEVE